MPRIQLRVFSIALVNMVMSTFSGNGRARPLHRTEFLGLIPVSESPLSLSEIT